MIIDANGADISKVMHGINQCYSQYINYRQKRHGHVFQDRFKSKVVDSKNYLFSLSAYIHNNLTELKGMKHALKTTNIQLLDNI
jgi:putative transposase